MLVCHFSIPMKSLAIGERHPRADFTQPIEGRNTLTSKWSTEAVPGDSHEARALAQRATQPPGGATLTYPSQYLRQCSQIVSDLSCPNDVLSCGTNSLALLLRFGDAPEVCNAVDNNYANGF